MSFIAVSMWDEDGRGVKFIPCKTKSEADAVLERWNGTFPGAFVTREPEGGSAGWRADPRKKTVVYDPLPTPPPPPASETIKREIGRNRALFALYSHEAGKANMTLDEFILMLSG